MDSTLFTITVNDTDYSVKTKPGIARLYDVSCGTAYHQIGKTDAGLWVYVENPALTNNMPLQEIGNAIDEYLGLEANSG